MLTLTKAEKEALKALVAEREAQKKMKFKVGDTIISERSGIKRRVIALADGLHLTVHLSRFNDRSITYEEVESLTDDYINREKYTLCKPTMVRVGNKKYLEATIIDALKLYNEQTLYVPDIQDS